MPGHLFRWGLFFAVGAAVYLVATRVNLTPNVESDFFFARSAAEEGGETPFLKTPPWIILSIEGDDLGSPEYADRIVALSADLGALTGKGTRDILHGGPKGFKDAIASPFFRRLVVASDKHATAMMVDFEGDLVGKIEEIVARHQAPEFRIAVSGVPYVVEQIRRDLLRDLKAFAVVTLVSFSLVIVLLFRSLSILTGMLVSCLTASLGALGLLFAVGMKPGILTANVLTITFVMTLSHLVFLTLNWVDGQGRLGDALRWTGGASFWSMATNLLGFLSLLLATAKPLREFAIAGSIGCGLSIVCAYLFFPLYLRAAKPSSVWTAPVRFLARNHLWASISILVLAAISVYGVLRVNRDPSILSYFGPGTPVRRGLESVDARLGSTPLDLAVRKPGQPKLTDKESFRALQALDAELVADPAVGSVLSLPPLIAEAERRSPLAKMMTLEGKIKALEGPAFQQAARNFITKEHDAAMYRLRMIEARPDMRRHETLARIEALAERHGFEVCYTSGLFKQMMEMSDLVMGSVYRGLSGLLILFVIISYAVARNVRWALAMVFALLIVSGCTLGVIGLFRWPVDIISSTAVNVTIGLGIDAMIHLVWRVRRLRISWKEARIFMGQPILMSAFILCGGFAIFVLSRFPPTQRFGLFVILGSMVALFHVLLVIPHPFAGPDSGSGIRSNPRESV